MIAAANKYMYIYKNKQYMNAEKNAWANEHLW
jgi:hypothetical protein